MKITKHTVPSVSYQLQVEGQIVDQAGSDQPLVFLFGVGSMIPGFEKELEGLEAGDQYDFKLNPSDAYGDVNPEAVVEVPLAVFQVEGQDANEFLKVGNTLPMQDQNGNPLQGTVVEVGEENVKMDFNHPLAGKELHFTGKVEDVREATSEEIDHGHAHGPGGHQH